MSGSRSDSNEAKTDEKRRLDQALEATFPGSDPVNVTQRPLSKADRHIKCSA